ncbi:MAG: hypothetical protein PHE55_05425 [Methylococcaceae bacterium]|nr:hypothetical protein [Methylococcaceae bacterium]
MKNRISVGALLIAVQSVVVPAQAATQSYLCGGAHGTSLNSSTQNTIYEVKNIDFANLNKATILTVTGMSIYDQNGASLRTYPGNKNFPPSTFKTSLIPFQSTALSTRSIFSTTSKGRLTTVITLDYPTTLSGPIPAQVTYSIVDGGTSGFLSRVILDCPPL